VIRNPNHPANNPVAFPTAAHTPKPGERSYSANNDGRTSRSSVCRGVGTRRDRNRITRGSLSNANMSSTSAIVNRRNTNRSVRKITTRGSMRPPSGPTPADFRYDDHQVPP